MKKCVAVLAILLSSMALFPTPLKAQLLCTAEYLSGCDDPLEEICLQKFYACGEFDAIVQTHSAEILQPSINSRYYLGAAFHGLHLRSRSLSYRCLYASRARHHLIGFLQSAIEEVDVLQHAEKIGHASKLYRRLSNVEGCRQDQLSAGAVVAQTKRYAEPLLRGLFAPGNSVGAIDVTVENARNSIQTALSGFVISAADTEVKLALRRQALDQSAYRFGRIIELYKNDENENSTVFGSAAITWETKPGGGQPIPKAIEFDPLPSEDTRLHSAAEVVQMMASKIREKDKEFQKALGGVDIAEYESLRAHHVGEARQILEESEVLRDHGLLLFPEGSSRASEINSIVADDPAQDSLDGMYEEIRKRWSASRAAGGFCTGRPDEWYC